MHAVMKEMPPGRLGRAEEIACAVLAPVSCSGTRWWWMAATPCADERRHEEHAERNGIMKALMATAATILMLALASFEANEPTVTVIRAGSQPSSRAPEEYFTGSVRRDPLFPATPPSRMVGGSVTFEAGARSAGIRTRSARS
jgi:hypothetical protein